MTTITTSFVAGCAGRRPPHIDGSSTYAVVVRPAGAGNGAISILKSAGGPFAEQDVPNRPDSGTTAGDYTCVESVLSGASIHVVSYNHTTGLLEYHRFSTSLGIWAVADHLVADLSGMSLPVNYTANAWIEADGSGRLCIFANGLTDSIMGTAFDRADAWYGPGTGTPSFTGPLGIPTNSGNQRTSPNIRSASGALIHLLWDVSIDMQGRSISADSGGLTPIVTDAGFGNQIGGPSRVFDGASQRYLAQPPNFTQMQVRRWVESGGWLDLLTAVGDAASPTFISADMATLGSDVYVLGVGDVDGGSANNRKIVYAVSSDYGDTWDNGTDAGFGTGHQESHVAPDGTTALAVIYGDTSTLVYDTISLVTGATSTGSLDSGDSTASGSAAVERKVAAALAAQASDVVGIAARVLTASGSLQAQASDVTGAASNALEVTATGSLDSQPSTASGTASRVLDATGALVSQVALASGLASRVVTATGSLDTGPSSAAGVAARTGVITATGSMDAGSAQIINEEVTREVTSSGSMPSGGSALSGAAEREVTATGSPSSGASSASGSATRVVTSASTLDAQPASAAGAATRQVTSSGAVAALAATASGLAARVLTATGSLGSGSASATGTANNGGPAVGSLEAGPSAVVGDAAREVSSSGALVSAPSAAAGTASRVLVASGSFQAGTASVAGTGSNNANTDATGALQPGPSSVSGSGTRQITAAGSLASAGAAIGASVIREVVVNTAALAANSSTLAGLASVNGAPTQVGSVKSSRITTGRQWRV